MAVAIDDPRARDIDHADRLVVLLRGDHLAAVGGEEGVVGDPEALAWRRASAGGKAPQDAPLGAHLEQAVVVTGGDQHRSGQDARVRAGSQVYRAPAPGGRGP